MIIYKCSVGRQAAWCGTASTTVYRWGPGSYDVIRDTSVRNTSTSWSLSRSRLASRSTCVSSCSLNDDGTARPYDERRNSDATWKRVNSINTYLHSLILTSFRISNVTCLNAVVNDTTKSDRCITVCTRKPSCRWQTRATRKHAKNCSNSTCLQNAADNTGLSSFV